jgi:hypothetical protein
MLYQTETMSYQTNLALSIVLFGSVCFTAGLPVSGRYGRENNWFGSAFEEINL